MKIIKYIFIFSFVLGYSQDKDNDNFVAAYSNACDCIAEISLEADDKNELIANCISLSLEKLETNQQSTSEQSPELYYKKIENYLVQNCESLKNIAFSENKKFKHASSENVLAQLAYDDGMEYINNGDAENAIQKFQKAVGIDPNFAFAWDNLGISYRKNQEYSFNLAMPPVIHPTRRRHHPIRRPFGRRFRGSCRDIFGAAEVRRL